MLNFVDDPGRSERPAMARCVSCRVKVRNDDVTSGSRGASQFAICGRAIGDMADHKTTPNDIESAVSDRKVPDVAKDGPHAGAGCRRSFGQHGGADIDTHRFGRAAVDEATAVPAARIEQSPPAQVGREPADKFVFEL